MKSIIFFVEGIHDANCVARILLLRDYKEANKIEELPNMWKDRVPRAYPFVNDRLDRRIPMPSYFMKNNLCVVIVCSHGVTNIVNDIDLYLSNMSKGELKQINGVCSIFDADQYNADEAFDERFKKYNKDMIINKKDFERGYCRVRGEIISLYHYFFPDNYSKGNLENFLLEGARVVYNDLLENVDEYIKKIDNKYKKNWSISSENKVKIGCISNVFQPGGANQTSIRYDDWISYESMEHSFVIKKFYNFVLNIIE